MVKILRSQAIGICIAALSLAIGTSSTAQPIVDIFELFGNAIAHDVKRKAAERTEQERNDKIREHEIALIKRLQTALAKLGYYDMKIDGDRGPGTLAAEERFKTNYNIRTLRLTDEDVAMVERYAHRLTENNHIVDGTDTAEIGPFLIDTVPDNTTHYLLKQNFFAPDDAPGKLLNIGTVASKSSICTLFQHPVFQRSIGDYEQYLTFLMTERQTRNRNFAIDWLSARLDSYGIGFLSTFKWSTEANKVQKAIDENVSYCLAYVHKKNPDTYNIIITHYIDYLSNNNLGYSSAAPCFTRGTHNHMNCVNWNAAENGSINFGRSALFLALLTLEEAHPILRTLLDADNAGIERAFAAAREKEEREKARAAEQRRIAAENERKQRAEWQRQAAERNRIAAENAKRQEIIDERKRIAAEEAYRKARQAQEENRIRLKDILKEKRKELHENVYIENVVERDNITGADASYTMHIISDNQHQIETTVRFFDTELDDADIVRRSLGEWFIALDIAFFDDKGDGLALKQDTVLNPSGFVTVTPSRCIMNEDTNTIYTNGFLLDDYNNHIRIYIFLNDATSNRSHGYRAYGLYGVISNVINFIEYEDSPETIKCEMITEQGNKLLFYLDFHQGVLGQIHAEKLTTFVKIHAQ